MFKNVISKSYIYCLSCVVLLYSCTVNKAKIDNDLKKYFDEKKVEGCFTMLDNSTGKITVYNMGIDTTRLLPASTFKIANALIGLETGKILDENMVIKWDGIKRPVEEWNKDLTFTEAFKVSAVPYFQEVARRIGKDSIKMYIDSLSYGNRNIAGAVDSFWLNNTLKISPDEQLGFLKRLYFDQLPFRKSVQQQVRDVLLQEDNTAYKLSYKTGLGFDEKNNAIGWIVGWIEENRHVYFFAQVTKSPNTSTIDMKPIRLEIAKSILKHYGFFEGKK